IPTLSQLRGHSSLAGSVDAVHALTGVPGPAANDTVTFDLHCVKQRDGRKVEPRRYTISMDPTAARVSITDIPLASERTPSGAVRALADALLLKLPVEGPGISANELLTSHGGKRTNGLAAIRLLENEVRARRDSNGRLLRVPDDDVTMEAN